MTQYEAVTERAEDLLTTAPADAIGSSDHTPASEWHAPSSIQWSPVPERTCRTAVASLILSVLWLCGLGSVVAIVLALVARRKIVRSEGKLSGGRLASAALVLAVLGLLGVLVASLLLVLGGSRSESASVQPGRSVSTISNGSSVDSGGQPGAEPPMVPFHPVPLGQTVFLDGWHDSMTVHGLSYAPLGTNRPIPTLPKGEELARIDVQVCAGYGPFVVPDLSEVQLLLPSRQTVRPVLLPLGSGSLQVGESLSASSCGTRMLLYPIAIGVDPLAVEFVWTTPGLPPPTWWLGGKQTF